MLPLWLTTVLFALGFQQKVDLGEWTSYLDLHPAQEDSHSVMVLLEARSPHNEDAFLTAAKNIPLAYQVHVGVGTVLSVC